MFDEQTTKRIITETTKTTTLRFRNIDRGTRELSFSIAQPSSFPGKQPGFDALAKLLPTARTQWRACMKEGIGLNCYILFSNENKDIYKVCIRFMKLFVKFYLKTSQ